MNHSPRLRSHLSRAAALVPASVVAVLACWSLSGLAGPGSTIPAEQTSAPVASAPGQPATAERVAVRVPGGLATVTLDDTRAARAFAEMLPLRLTLHDPMGQAKSGRRPSAIDVVGAATDLDPKVGELCYWAPSHMVVILYDDLGQTVPPPGLIRLGVVDSSLSSISTAGNRFPVRIETADRSFTRTES
jgi:hypothetical protein